jgi:hypothetical protein
MMQTRDFGHPSKIEARHKKAPPPDCIDCRENERKTENSLGSSTESEKRDALAEW